MVERLGLSRRGFLAAAAAAAAASALPAPRRRLLQMNGYPIDAEAPLDALTTYLTPNDFFFIRHHWNPAFPDPGNWALTVDGEVSRAARFSLSELKTLPQTTVTCVLQGAGNGRGLQRPIVPGVQWINGAVGNARWTGVRVRDLLERAGLKAGARHLHTFGADKPPEKVPPFYRSVELEKVLEDGVVALAMNGEPLPQLHGGPARLVVPGWAGDHWMKWLDRLTAAPAPQTGFYMDTAYRFPNAPGQPGVPVPPTETHPVTEIFVKSSITQAPARVRLGEAAPIRGFAFSGAPDIAKVEVSDDGGASWKPADLGTEHDPHAWRLWSFSYRPRAQGKVTLHARATDSRGSVQPRDAAWNPSGYFYNAWPLTEIEVTA
jgi:DMSO/TMAO reductase YedYZ molybdopterin-dependent catalytic subunit